MGGLSFEDRLLLTVVDKAAIGLIVLVCGYLLNRLLEKFKSSASLRNELVKDRDRRGLEFAEKQLSQFYWPLYTRLHFDTAVWTRILEKDHTDDELRRRIGAGIEAEFILPNHEEAIKIIREKIHLMEGDDELFGLLRQYLRHVAVYKAMREAGEQEKYPKHVGEPWPKELVRKVEEETQALQDTYDSLLAQERGE